MKINLARKNAYIPSIYLWIPLIQKKNQKQDNKLYQNARDWEVVSYLQVNSPSDTQI